MQFDRTAAGHNGVQNLIDRLGTKAFHRIRIGIGPKKIEARDFVLAKFSKDELKTMAESISTVLDAVDTIVHAE
jgi:PTH1 family peptidyl-tRNA hydrolase